MLPNTFWSRFMFGLRCITLKNTLVKEIAYFVEENLSCYFIEQSNMAFNPLHDVVRKTIKYLEVRSQNPK